MSELGPQGWLRPAMGEKPPTSAVDGIAVTRNPIPVLGIRSDSYRELNFKLGR